MATNQISVVGACEKVYGITPRRYQQLAKEGFVPAGVKGEIDFIASTKAIIEYYRKKAEGSGSISLTDERTRLTKLQADLVERELREKDSELLPFEQVKADWLRYCGAVKARLLNLPTKYAPICFGKTIAEIKETIEGGIHQALAELVQLKYDEQSKTVVRGGEHLHPAVKNDGKRMGGRRKSIKPRIKRGAGKVADNPGTVSKGDDGRLQRSAD